MVMRCFRELRVDEQLYVVPNISFIGTTPPSCPIRWLAQKLDGSLVSPLFLPAGPLPVSSDEPQQVCVWATKSVLCEPVTKHATEFDEAATTGQSGYGFGVQIIWCVVHIFACRSVVNDGCILAGSRAEHFCALRP